MSAPADPDVTVVGTPIELEFDDVLFLDNSVSNVAFVAMCERRRPKAGTQQITIPPRRAARIKGAKFSRVTPNSQQAAGINYYWNLDTFAEVNQSSSGGVVIVPDLGSAPFPLIAAADVIAETDFNPIGGETWEITGVHNPPSAGLAGTVTLWLNAAKSQMVWQKPLAVTDNEMIVQPIQLKNPGVVAINVTGGGAAGTKITVSGRRVN